MWRKGSGGSACPTAHESQGRVDALYTRPGRTDRHGPWRAAAGSGDRGLLSEAVVSGVCAQDAEMSGRGRVSAHGQQVTVGR